MNSIMTTLLARLGGLVLTLVIASIVIYSAVLATGDPIATLAGGAKPTPELVAQIRAEYHLDDPVWVRYWLWLTHAVQGDFGRSFVYNTDVATLIAPRLAITVQLVVLTVVLILLLGVGSGIVAALRGRAADTAVTIGTSLGMALPTFVVAILLIWIFAKTLGWFPVFGEGADGWDRVWHLVLPSLSLAVLFSAYVSRVTRSSLVAQLGSEHVETARVRGISNGRIFRTHVLRNAAPQILAISGTTVAGLFAASAIAEVAFGIGGVGSLLVQAAARADLPVVQIISLLLVAIFVVLNAVADIVSAAIDPSSVAGGMRA